MLRLKGQRPKAKKQAASGAVSATSFYPSKDLREYIGDAGAVTTNDKDLAHKINLFRT
jgi:dTDP-4-amino-4,6-dideoxygalactose transaminase